MEQSHTFFDVKSKGNGGGGREESRLMFNSVTSFAPRKVSGVESSSASAGVGATFSTRTALFFVRRAAHLLTLDGARVFLACFVGLAVVAVRPLFRSLRSLQHSKRQ